MFGPESKTGSPYPIISVDNLDEGFELYGLENIKTRQAWYRGSGIKDFDAAVAANVEALNQIGPDGASLLARNFNLRTVARYPVNLLQEQIDNFDNQDMLYGTVFFPHSDKRNNFYSRGDVYQKLADQLKQLDPNFGIRFFEVAGVRALIEAILWCDHKYNQNGNKIAFSVLAGHADEQSLELGWNGRNPDAWIHTNKLAEYRVAADKQPYQSLKQHIMAAYKPNPVWILDACRTGRKDSIAQELSNFGAEVWAPTNKWTNVKEFNPKLGAKGELSFDVKYTNRSPRALYYRGMPIKPGQDLILSSRPVS